MKIILKLKLNSYIKSLLQHLSTYLSKQLSFFGYSGHPPIEVKNWHEYIEYFNGRNIGQEILDSALNLETEAIIITAKNLIYDGSAFKLSFVTSRGWLTNLFQNSFGLEPVTQAKFTVLHAAVDEKIANRMIKNLSDISFAFKVNYSDFGLDMGPMGNDFVIKPTSAGLKIFSYHQSVDNVYKVVKRRNQQVVPDSGNIHLPDGFHEVKTINQLTVDKDNETFNPEFYAKLLTAYSQIKDLKERDLTEEEKERVASALQDPKVGKKAGGRKDDQDGIDGDDSDSDEASPDDPDHPKNTTTVEIHD